MIPAPIPPALSWDFVRYIFEWGFFVFAMIEALKNVPWFADFFVTVKWLAVWVSGIFSLITAVLLCLKMESHDQAFYMCLITALGIFLSAAAAHKVLVTLSPDKSSSPAVSPERVAKMGGPAWSSEVTQPPPTEPEVEAEANYKKKKDK